MAATKTPEKTISQILDELDREDLRVFAWRLHCLERAGFECADAILIARSNADLHQTVRMVEQGCDHALVAKIVG